MYTAKPLREALEVMSELKYDFSIVGLPLNISAKRDHHSMSAFTAAFNLTHFDLVVQATVEVVCSVRFVVVPEAPQTLPPP